jgi:hypothetical protein
LLAASACASLLASAAASDMPAAWLSDATASSGIPSIKYGEGACFTFNGENGRADLFLPVVKGRNRMLRNRGDGRFAEIAGDAGAFGTGGIGALFADLDGDGRDELFVVRGAYPYGTNLLYAADADGKWREVSAEAGLAARRNGISTAMADVDGDGRLDIFVANWGRNTLYLNRSEPERLRFVDATDAAGLGEEGRSWSATFSDLDGDGHPDLVVARGGDGKSDGLKYYRNRGAGTFEDCTAAAGLGGLRWSMSVVAADLDGDGSFDLFVGGYDGPDRLFRNDGHGRFTDVTASSGIRSGHSVGGAAGDLDGDLLPEIASAGFSGPVRLFRNLGGMRFEELGARAGVGSRKRNEGIVFADVDGDGALDLYASNYDGHNRLYRNTAGRVPALAVRPSVPGRTAVGSVARLYEAGRLGDPRALLSTMELQAGSGYCAQPPAEWLFRLPGGRPCDLRVTFPGGAVAERRNVGPGRVTIRPGKER